MAVKRKDFQKTSAYIHQFLLKLDSTPECAEVRDALNLALLHMQKYYRYLRRRLENRDKDNASLSNSSLRGLSPMTPPVERPEQFEWRWQDLEGRRMSLLRSQEPGLPLGMSLALSASKTGDLETLKALHSNNPACLDECDGMGRGLLMYAVQFEQFDTADWLLRHGADVNAVAHDQSTALHLAAHKGLRLVQVDEFADGMERDASGWTFLHWAVRRQEPLECLRTLITEENAVVTDMSGKNVLMVAAEQGSLPACKIIMEVGGKSIIDYRDQDSRSAVHLATIGGHGEVLNFLLDQGADMEARDRDHATPWDYAKQRQLNYCKLILASHYRQRCKDLELASQNSLQDQMRAPVNLATSDTPSSRSKSPSSSTRRRLRGVVAPVQQQQEEQREEQREGHQDSADACDAENGFERREPDPSQQHRQPQQQQLQLLESYRTMDSEDFNAASSVAQESRRPTAARGGPRPTASPRSRTPQTPQTPQSPQQPPHPDRRLTRSQPPYKLQRQMAENNGSVDAVAAAGGGYAASEASQQQPPVTLSSQLPAPAPPPPAQFGRDGDSIAGAPRTPPDKQRLIGPPPQLMPLNYSGGGGAAVLRHQLHTEPTPPHLPPPQQLQAQQLPPTASPQQLGGSGGQQPIAKASVYLPSSGRPRPHRSLALQAQQAPDGRHHQPQQQ
uniref:ANK_REP_REGION domain-containing protein n=1 Tax=Macrostomum lignano TaxID=282301 RepID=A0A1I8H7U7_9PLAT